jgi:C4-dicarboxylate transporter DctM subunit
MHVEMNQAGAARNTGGAGIIGVLGKAIDTAADWSSRMAGCFLLVIAFVTVYEVICRYIFNSPTIWTLDLSIYLLIWFSYASIASLQRTRRHIRVDLLISHFSRRTREAWEIMTHFIFLFFILWMIYYVCDYTLSAYLSHEYGWSMWRVLMWPVKAALPFGTILLGLLLIKDLITGFQTLSSLPQEKGTKPFNDRPSVIIPLFLILVAGSIYGYTLHGGLGMLCLMLVLLFGGVPIFAALGLTGVLGLYLVIGGATAVSSSLPAVSYNSLENFALVCLPLYVFVGQAISASGVSDEIFETATKWVGHLPGGGGVATILACSIFAAVSVSSVATATTIGLIAIPAMVARGYNKSFTYGLLAAGGTLGIMIPPSGTMIIYSAVTEESLGKLFMAGVIPGILLASLFIVYSILYCKRTGEYERIQPATWGERFRATKNAMWGLLAPVIIMGGIYSGIFTPLEAGGVAAVYVLVMILARRKVKPGEILKMLGDSTFASTMILSIIVGAMLLGEYMTLTKIPDQAIDFVSSLKMPPWGVIATLMFLYVILGMFLEVVSIMLITLPIVYPLIIKLGYDGIWFAVMITLNMEMACITPPVGLNLYAIQGIARAPLAAVLKGVWPFFIIMVIWMVLLALFPLLSTWLPQIVVPAK